MTYAWNMNICKQRVLVTIRFFPNVYVILKVLQRLAVHTFATNSSSNIKNGKYVMGEKLVPLKTDQSS